MLKILLVSLLLVAVAQARIEIRFPVNASPPGRWFFGPSNGEFCTSTKTNLWRRTSKFDCVLGHLKDNYKFTDSVARRLISYADGFKPRLPGRTGHPIKADNDSRKALCKAAHDCECKIHADWCKHYDI